VYNLKKAWEYQGNLLLLLFGLTSDMLVRTASCILYSFILFSSNDWAVHFLVYQNELYNLLTRKILPEFWCIVLNVFVHVGLDGVQTVLISKLSRMRIVCYSYAKVPWRSAVATSHERG